MIKVYIKFVLKNARIKAGLSQEKLAAATDLSQSFISDIENSRRVPSLASINKIAYVLNINPFSLLELESVDKRTLLLFLILFL